MKKTIFLLLMGVLALGAYAGTGASYDDPVEFSWTEGHEQPANTVCWYEVNLDEVPGGYDALLYLNNIDDATATITAQPFVLLSSLSSLNDAVTKQIVPARNYAMTLSHSAINALNTKTVYVKLKTDKRLRFSAEPVEPGERDLECLNAVDFVRAGTAAPSGTTWYAVDIADLKADPSKTVQVSVTNNGTAAAAVTAGISFDCPSTATTDISRTLAVGETRTKLIDRAFIDMLAVDLLYIAVQTPQPLFIKAEVVDAPVQDVPVISGEIDFLLDTQYTLAAGDQWYRVNVKELREAGKVAELTLVNTGTATATISADVAFSNPAASVVSRSITLSQNAVLVRDLARNLLESVAGDYAWVRLSTTSAIAFSARLKNRTEGTACMAARAFDWSNGDYQTAGTTVWYAVDIADAKSETNIGKDIMVTVENLSSSKEATLAVQLAFECPYAGTTDATRTLAAGATRSKRIERGLYTNLLTDVVYVGLTTTENVRITASLVDAEETEWSADCELDKATLFDWVNGNNQAAGTAVWYRVELTDLFTKLDTVPEIVVSNLGTTVASIAGELAFACPALEPTTQRRIEVSPSSPYVKTLTRNLIETLASDVVFIRVETTQPIHIQATLKKENEGLNCTHALDFDWQHGNVHPAGKTLWYKVALTDVKNTPGQAVRIGIGNRDGVAGTVSANLYFSCNEDAFYSYQMTLGANAKRETDLGRATIMNLKADTVYIELTSTQTDSLYAILYEDVLIEPIEACAGAVPVEYNTDIVQPAGEQWYSVDMDYLQKFTSGDATLTITNTSASSSVLTAQLAWTCPVVEQMLDRTLTVPAGAVYTKVVARTLIDNVANDTAWICVTASEEVTFRVDISDQRGLSCSAPILFDWVNGNTHPAQETLWYKVELDTLRNESEDDLHDFRLNVLNLMEEAITASAEIYYDCLDGAVTDPISYGFDPEELKWRDIDRDLLNTFGWAPLLIKFTSTGDVHLSAELITPIPDLVIDTTIVDTVCAGLDVYLYTIGDKEFVVEGPFLNDTAWTDTLRFTINFDHYTQLVDTVYKRELHCLLTPEFVPVTVVPVAMAGKAIDTSAATQALLDAFAAQKQANAGTRLDADVVSVTWQWQPAGRFVNLTGDLLDTRTEDIVLMRYVILTECNDEVASEPFMCPVAEPLRETRDSAAIVCAGTAVQSRNQASVVILADTLWNDTVFNLVHQEGVQLKDSVYTYNYRVWKQPLVPSWDQLTAVLSLQQGASVDVAALEQEILVLLNAATADDVIPVTGLTWQVQDADGNWQPLTGAPLAYDLATLVLRFGLLTDGTCDTDILYGEPHTFAVTPADVVEAPVVIDTLCAGDTYTPEHGEPRVIETDTEWTEIEYVGTVENRYTYRISVFRPVALPALSVQPLAVCGQLVQTAEADAALAAALEAAVTDINSTPEEYWWEILSDGDWNKLADVNAALDSNTDEISLRYLVRTSCNDTLQSEVITLEVQFPTADNTPDMDNLPAVSKYNDWLLMVNLNKINEQGWYPAAEDVTWYRVTGELDAALGERDDEPLGTGYYYTVAGKLTGDYYALVNITADADHACGALLRTVVLSCAPAPQTVSLAPAMVAPGEEVSLTGLNPQQTYTVEIYSLAGVCLQRITVAGTSAYTFSAQTGAGYYMVNVADEATMQTLKYIVK